MKTKRGKIATDAAIGSILEANAARVFEKNEVILPSDADSVLGAEASISNNKIHVDSQGFLSTKRAVRSKQRK